jgi:hypothetical protein
MMFGACTTTVALCGECRPEKMCGYLYHVSYFAPSACISAPSSLLHSIYTSSTNRCCCGCSYQPGYSHHHHHRQVRVP